MDDFYRNLTLTSVIISSGGVYGLRMLHVLDQLDSMGALQGIRHWSGTSIGSICALFMNIGVKPADIVPLIQSIPSKFTMTPQSILSVPDTFGFVSHAPFRTLLETVLEKRGILPSITFGQLYAFTKQTLSIFATNIRTNTLTAFHYKTTPDVPILDAALASCSIPIVFPPFKIGNESYIDGATLSDWGVDTSLVEDGSKTLLIRAAYTPTNVSEIPNTFTDYIQYLFNLYSQNVERLTEPMRRFQSTVKHTICIPFHRPCFDLTYANETEEVLQRKAREVLQDSIVNNS